MRVYEDSNMIRFASNDGATQYFSQPKGDVSVAIVGNTKFQFFSKSRNKYITSPLDYNDVLNSSGAAYGANFNAVYLALNAFLNSFFFDITSDDVTNESSVVGVTVTDALNTLQSEKLQWKRATANTTDASFVDIITFDANDYSTGTILVLEGKIFAKTDGLNFFYAGTFTAVAYHNGTVFTVPTTSIPQTIIDDYATNPQVIAQAGGNYIIQVSSNLVRNINWVFLYTVDIEVLP